MALPTPRLQWLLVHALSNALSQDEGRELAAEVFRLRRVEQQAAARAERAA